MAVTTHGEAQSRPGDAEARPERVRRMRARVAAAVEAGYLAQLSRDLRPTITAPARAMEPCSGRAA